MLLFLGGAARTGKGMLVRRLLAEQRLPYLSLDVLKMGLTRGAPEFPIDPDAGGMAVAERLWPIVREMSGNLLAERSPYAFEGELLPMHVAALRAEARAPVFGCFLGYAAIDPRVKLVEIRTHAGYPNDWPETYTDEALLPIIQREIAFSRYLRAECAAHNLPYIDLSEHFTAGHDQVVALVQAWLRAAA